MFNYLLPIPHNTHYQRLHVGPEAPADIIKEAANKIKNEYRKEKNESDKALAEVYDSVPGLKDAYNKIKMLQEKGADIDHEEIKKVQNEIHCLEKEAELIRQGFQKLRDKSNELETKISKLNRIALHQPENRHAYDKANPPLELFKLASETYIDSLDRTTLIFLIRKELSMHFANQDKKTYHPTDLTKEDFTGDFHYNPLLDGDK